MRCPLQALTLTYVAFILYATTLPFQFTLDRPTLAAKIHWINWDPTHLVTGEPTPIADLVSNVMFFVPLGILGGMLSRRRGPGVVIAAWTTLGFLLSLSVEVLQFFTPARNPATSDLITNTMGAFLGAILAAAFARHMQGALLHHLKRLAAQEPLLLYVVALVFWLVLRALAPFDFLIAVNELKHSLRGARLMPELHLEVWGKAILDVAAYAMTAGMTYAVLGRLWRRAAAVRYAACILAVCLLALGLEFLQLCIRSRVADTLDVLMAWLGILLGPFLAMPLLRGSSRTSAWLPVGLVYGLAVVVDTLEPFRFDFDLEAIRSRFDARLLMPYYTHYFRATIAAVNEFLDGLLMYMPLGFLVARQVAVRLRPGTLRMGLLAALANAVLALILEALQLGLPERYADVSDLVTAALGGLLGAFLWGWLEQIRVMELEPPSRMQIQVDSSAPTETSRETVV